MKKYNLLFILLVAIQLISCYDDKGNYDYSEINTVTISGLPKEQVIMLQYGGMLSVPVTIESSHYDNEENYSFRWVAYPINGSKIDNQDTFELSSEKNLNYNVILPQGEFDVYFYVKDNRTGIETRKSFPFKVTSATRDGWLVLQDEEGRVRLDMISKIGNEEFFLNDILKESPLPYKKGAKSIIMESNQSVDFNTPGVMLLTEEGTTNLNTNTLQWSGDLDLKHYFGDVMPTVKANAFFFLNFEGYQLCLTDDYLYPRSTQTPGSIYVVPINKLANENNYLKLAPFIGTNPYAYAYGAPVIVYDKENRRFIQVSSQRNSCIVPTATETVFSNSTKKDMVTMISTNHNQGTVYSLLKDNSNKIWLYGFEVSKALKQAEKYYYEMEATNIEKATMFAIHPYYFYLFYVADNIIYQFDLTTKACKPISQTFPGEVISMIKFNHLYNGDSGKPQWYKDLPYHLIVGSTKNGGKASENGVVRMFDVSTRFDEDLTLLNEYNGYAKPVDVTYRERLN